MRRLMTSTRCLMSVALIVLLAHTEPALAQEPKPQGPQAPQPVPRAQPKPPAQEREPAGRPVNLQIEVTVTDQPGSAPAVKKSVLMVVADRALGRIRSSTTTELPKIPGFQNLRLNIDARPEIQANDAIRLMLTLEYQPPPSDSSEAGRLSPLNESISLFLQSGKPLTVSRAADPTADRRVTVEVTATIMK